nr:hypothetical protein GCM10025699_35210 [Microbacterium flavescens]
MHDRVGGARDDDIGGGCGLREIIHRLQPVLQCEGGGATRRREDLDVGGTAGAHGLDGARGVAARADDHHARRGPVGDAAGRELEREPHERAVGAAQPGAVADAAAGVRGLLEEALELSARRALEARGVECAAHLARDLVLADDHGLEAAGHREEVGCGIRSGMDGHRGAQGFDGNVGCLGHRLDDRFGRDGLAAGERLVDVEVGLEPVAGGEDDRPGDEELVVHEGPGGRRSALRQPLQDVETRVPMVRGQTEEHPTMLRHAADAKRSAAS